MRLECVGCGVCTHQHEAFSLWDEARGGKKTGPLHRWELGPVGSSCILTSCNKIRRPRLVNLHGPIRVLQRNILF